VRGVPNTPGVIEINPAVPVVVDPIEALSGLLLIICTGTLKV